MGREITKWTTYRDGTKTGIRKEKIGSIKKICNCIINWKRKRNKGIFASKNLINCCALDGVVHPTQRSFTIPPNAYNSSFFSLSLRLPVDRYHHTSLSRVRRMTWEEEGSKEVPLETRSRVSRFYRFPDELGKKFSLLVSESLKKRRKNRKNFRIARLTEAKNRLYRKWKIRLVAKIENEPWTFKRVIFKWPSIGFLLTWFERFIQSQIVEGVIELENGLSH